MPLTMSGFLHPEVVDLAVREVEKSFAPQVVRIGHSFDDDHLGHPAIFFRILVTDEAIKLAHLREIDWNLSRALRHAVKTAEYGLHAHFSYRSVSEQEELKDPSWDE